MLIIWGCIVLAQILLHSIVLKNIWLIEDVIAVSHYHLSYVLGEISYQLKYLLDPLCCSHQLWKDLSRKIGFIKHNLDTLHTANEATANSPNRTISFRQICFVTQKLFDKLVFCCFLVAPSQNDFKVLKYPLNHTLYSST